MKIRTELQFQDFLDDESAWRLREIDFLKDESRKASQPRKIHIIRAGITLLYAHWEGFVKAAAEALLCYVANQGHLYRDLQPCFVAHGLATHLELLAESRRHAKRAECVSFLANSMKDKASFRWKGVVATQSNLNSDVFKNIFAAIGVPTSRYETRFHLIDESLLRRRNSIAHGEHLDVDERGFLDLADEVLALLRGIKADLENFVVTKAYLRS